MSTRPFARAPLVLVFLAAGALNDPQSPTSENDAASPRGPAADVTAAATYTVKNLGTLRGAQAEANAINDQGRVVGWSETRSGNTHAFLWQNGTMRDLGTFGGSTSVAWDINRAGKIVGGSATASGAGHPRRRPCVHLKDGVFKDLGTHGPEFATATAVNTRSPGFSGRSSTRRERSAT
jgi:probable HAF family extracellular repeat protein